ncbi:radical SAM/SPASM domain-containing protein [Sedimentibacter sp.]|uniref:radical SAM/SPASM domain-containing protein n=1 Tax=Sedimentibacter sp. TaxID=1960295 RepID=UPI0028AA8427|nr:radical SAM protein [Sedimentibacter sp.]
MNKSYSLTEVKIEVTYRCPLACIHCSSDAYINNDKQISYEKCREIIEQAKDLGVSEITFSGGEPLICEYIDDIISLTHSNGIKTCIYTSGYISDIENQFSKLKHLGLCKAVFSLYSFKCENHERITRIEGSFDKTIRSIKECVKIGIDAEVHFVAVSQTFRELNEVVRFCKNLGVNKISILRFVPQGRGMLYMQGVLNKNENLELIKMIKNIQAEGYEIRTGSPFNVLLLNKNPECYAARNRIIITPDLRVYPCDAFKNIMAEDVVGNLDYSTLSNSTLEECWHKSSYLNKIRKELDRPTGEPCNDCDSYDYCKSGCLAQKFLYYEKFTNIADPACLYNGSIKNVF